MTVTETSLGGLCQKDDLQVKAYHSGNQQGGRQYATIKRNEENKHILRLTHRALPCNQPTTQTNPKF